MTQLVLRFDVDTPRCVRAGMRELNRLSEEFAAQFVFFVNFGRAIDLAARSGKGDDAGDEGVQKLGTLQKQTVLGIAELLVRNPRLADVGAAQIETAAELGSEIGVHGGTNHGTWQWAYRSWDERRIAAEVAWSTEAYRKLLGRDPVGFSSPGWVSDERIAPILVAKGYSYMADLHGTGEHTQAGLLSNFATVLTGEPGGVGYFESCMARGVTTEWMLGEIEAAVADSPEPVVLYDHPCFAGFRGRPLLRAVLEHAKKKGWNLVTLAEKI